MLKQKPAIERHKRDAEAQLAERVETLRAKGMEDARIQRDATVRHLKGKIRQARYQLAEIVALEALIVRKQEAKAARLSNRQIDQPRKKRPADPAKKKARQERKQVIAEETTA